MTESYKEENLMKVKKSYVEKDKKINITFETNEELFIGDIVSIQYGSETRYFEIFKVETNEVEPEDFVLTVYAKNYGYYDIIRKIDLRRILLEKVSIVNDDDILKKLHRSSTLI